MPRFRQAIAALSRSYNRPNQDQIRGTRSNANELQIHSRGRLP